MKDKILKEYKEGNIVIATIDGLQIIPIEEFIKQPANGMLYDLNRNEATILSFVDDDPKWINDYAACKVIKLLKAKITNTIYVFRFGCPYEGTFPQSYHKTLKGAYRAMNKHLNEVFNEWRDTEIMYGKSPKDYYSNPLIEEAYHICKEELIN